MLASCRLGIKAPCHFSTERASYFYQSFSRVRFYDALRLKRFWISVRAGPLLENLEVALSFLSIRNPVFVDAPIRRFFWKVPTIRAD